MELTAEKLRGIFAPGATIAVVGASPNPNRPVYRVMEYLIRQGFKVVPVRPKVAELMDLECYGALEDIPFPVHVVDVFRKPEACPDVARSAVAVGAKVLWLQEGIISREAADIAAAGGLQVIMDLCTMKEHCALAAGER